MVFKEPLVAMELEGGEEFQPTLKMRWERRKLRIRSLIKGAKEKISSFNASTDLDQLCEAGCDQESLLYLLAMCADLGPSSAKVLTGYSSTQLKRHWVTLKSAATIVQNINNNEFGRPLELYDEHFARFLNLDETLRQFQALVSHAVKHIAGQQPFYLTIARAELTEYILKSTGRYHDNETAALLSCMLDVDYTADNQRVWRNGHKKKLAFHTPETNESLEIKSAKSLLEYAAAQRYRNNAVGNIAPRRTKRKAVPERKSKS